MLTTRHRGRDPLVWFYVVYSADRGIITLELPGERLSRPEQCVADGVLTAEQLADYERLKALVAQNRPIIRRLQES